jgi:PST family polysaccharide transporter
MNERDVTAAARPARSDAGDALDVSLVRGLAWTGSAKLGVQLVSWVATIAVARFLAPSDYGLMQLCAVCLTVVGLVSELSIGLAVVTIRQLSAAQIAQLNGLSIGLGVASSAVTLAAAPLLGALFAAPELPGLVALLSPLFLLTALRTVPQSLLQREFRFRPLALVESSQGLIGALLTFLLAASGLGYLSLAIGRLCASAWWSAGVLAFRRHALAVPRLAPLREALRFSLDVFAAHLAWFAYSNLHFLIIGQLLGTSALGAFTIAWTLAHVAADRIAALLVGVVPSYLSALREDRAGLRRYFLGITQALAFAVVPLAWGTSLVARDFVPLVLGPRWLGAVGALEILPHYAAFFAISSLLPPILRVLGETRLCLLCNAATAVGMSLAVWLATPWGITGAAWAWLLVYPPLTAMLYARLLRHLELGTRDYLRALSPALSSGAAMALGVLACRALLSGAPGGLRLALEVAVGAAVYAGFAWTVHPERIRAFHALLRSALR